MNYLVCQIAGRQYLLKPGQVVEVNKLLEEKKLVVDQVLLKVDGEKVSIGTPYLKEKVELDILGTIRGEKIRVAKYKSKVNSRRVRGSRSFLTQVRLPEAKSK